MYQALRNATFKKLKTEQYHIIIATSPPLFTLHVAAEASRRSGAPWVADFRDIPTELGKSDKNFKHEKKQLDAINNLLKSSAGITVVSQSYLEALNHNGKPVACIQNGYDASLYQAAEAATQEKQRKPVQKLLYSGSLAYDRATNLKVVFDALDILTTTLPLGDTGFSFTICGSTPEIAKKALGNRPCRPLVTILGQVPYTKNLELQREADALLLLTHPTSNVGVIPSKIFEYMAARKPILSVPQDSGPCDDLLTRTGCGITASTPEQVAEIIRGWQSTAWHSDTRLYPQRNETVIQYHSRQAQSQKLARFLNTLLEQHQ